MKLFWFFLYNCLFYPLVFVGYFILALVSPKVKDGFFSRFSSISTLKNYFKDTRKSDVYWFHAASLGEFMQLLPIIDILKKRKPGAINLVSFFSPSGYNNCESDSIDLKIYLPFDFIWSVYSALNIVKPKKLIFVSYDIWPNMLWTAKRKGVKTNIFSVGFRVGTNKLFHPIRSFYFSLFSSFDAVYTNSDGDKLIAEQLLGENTEVSIEALGNPRFDTVYRKSKKVAPGENKKSASSVKTLVLGSTHNEDDRIILEPVIRLLDEYPDLRLVCVPHEVTEARVSKYQKLFSKNNISATVFNQDDVGLIPDDRVIIIAVIGLLSDIYTAAGVAYIGGGFSSGIHNVMEPAAASMPVIFGPNFKQFSEARELIDSGGGFSISSGSEFKKICADLLTRPEKFQTASGSAFSVIEKNIGASEKIFSAVFGDLK